MLYATTRNKEGTYPARRAVKEDWAPDGGLYLPERIPKLEPEALDALLQRPAGEIVAQVLNLFFGTKITGPEVIFVVGRRFYRTAFPGHRIAVGELWRNSDDGFEPLCRRLSSLICAEMAIVPSVLWMRIACRVALYFAVFADAQRELPPGEALDAAVLTESFEGPYALWVAREMGLNIGTIICCDNENGLAWDLFNRGQLRLNGECVETLTPECNVTVPRAMELYFHSVLGWDGGQFEKLETGATHIFLQEEQERLSEGFAAAVIGDERVKRIMANIYRSYDYILCPYSALLYGGVEDYRSQCGRARGTLILHEHDPRSSTELVTRTLGIQPEDLCSWCIKR